MQHAKRALAVLLSLLMAFSAFGGMTFSASAFDPEQGSAGVALYEDFENEFPDDWTKQIDGSFAEAWTIYAGDKNIGPSEFGSYFILAFQDESNGVARLYTPTLDLSGYTALVLSLAFRNRAWAGDCDLFYIYYRVNEGEWMPLFATEDAHEEWTELKLELPEEALAANVQIGFEMESIYGYGVCMDNVKIANPALETIALIDAIGTVEYTDASKALIDAAREAYDALTDAQKDLVTNYTTLTDAEAMYAALTPASVTETYTVFVDVTEFVPDGDAYRVSAEVAPAQIGDTITVTVLDANGETVYRTSIAAYCRFLLDGEYEQSVKNLAAATLEYGKAANDYFSGQDFYEQSEIHSPITAEQRAQALDELANKKALAATGEAKNVFTGASFMALTKPEFRFYTTGLTEAEAAALNSGITVSCANSSVNMKDVKVRFVKSAQNNETILLEVTGIEAKDMDEVFTVNFGSFGTLTFTGYDFARMMASSNAAQALGVALYLYGEAAGTLFA